MKSIIQNRGAVKGTAMGLFFMAVFTCLWAVLAESCIQLESGHAIVIIFSIFSLIFAVYGIYLLINAKKIPAAISAEDKAEGKRIMKWFSIALAAEVLAILIIINLLGFLNKTEYSIPAIALIVGLHFYPMAKIFKRKIDYYIATWSCLIAMMGFFITKKHIWNNSTLFLFIGMGMAISTTAYGFYMILTGRRILNSQGIKNIV